MKNEKKNDESASEYYDFSEILNNNFDEHFFENLENNLVKNSQENLDEKTVDYYEKNSIKIEKINLLSFINIWNKTQEQTTPKHHKKIATWLENLWLNKMNRRGLLMAFRGSGKSTIVGLFCAWLLYNNPNLRILVISAEERLAGKMSKNVKSIIEHHPLLTPLIPEKKSGQWASKEFSVNREKSIRDPSMIAIGLTGNLTGSRADVIICDDVEVPNTSDTILKQEDLRDRLEELEFIITPTGIILYIGTPHSANSIYF